MSKFWMVIFAIIALVWVGGYATDAGATTNQQARACVDEHFARAPFTGTLAQKEAQARRLPANKPFGDPQITLPEGGSLWDYCKTTAPALNIDQGRVTALQDANGALKREVARLEGLAYETINARDRTTGFVSDGTAWKDRATAYKGERDTAKANTKSAGNWDLLIAILAGVAALAALLLYGKFRKARDDHKKASDDLMKTKQALFDLQTQKPVVSDAPTPPSGDADLDAPTAPGPKPAEEPARPAFLDRLEK